MQIVFTNTSYLYKKAIDINFEFIISKSFKNMDDKVFMLLNCAIISMLCVCSVQSTSSNCKPEFQTFKFWNCKGTTATFDSQAHQNVSFDTIR